MIGHFKAEKTRREIFLRVLEKENYPFRDRVPFFGLYSFASIRAAFFDGFNGWRGGLGGGGERVLLRFFSDFAIETEDEERKRTVFKFEFRFNEKVLLIGNVDEPFVGRMFFRLETLFAKKHEVILKVFFGPNSTLRMFSVFFHWFQLAIHWVRHHC